MSKKKNDNAFTIVALLAIAVVLGFYFKVIPLAVSGWTTLSLGQVSVISNDANLNGQAWLMTVSENGGGEHAQGTWNSTSPEFSGVTTKPQSFTIQYDYIEQYCKYPISSVGGMDVKTAYIQNKDFSYLWLASDRYAAAQTWCFNQLNGNWLIASSLTAYNCVGYTGIGRTGTFGPTYYRWAGNIQLTTKNGVVSGTISDTTGATALTLNNPSGQPVLWAKWAGNLVSGQNCPSTSNVIPAYDTQAQAWRISNNAYYTSYVSKYNGMDNCLQNHQSDPSFCVNDFNPTALNLIQGSYSDPSFTGVQTIQNGTDFSYARIDENMIQYPVIAMKIKADWVGIVANCGRPSITQVDSTVTGTATQKVTGHATIGNTESVDASFGAYLTCPYGVSVDPIANFPVSASGSKQISYGILSASETHSTCTLNVYDLNCPDRTTSATFTLNLNRYCPLQCGGTFVLDSANCVCICPLTPQTCKTIDTTNCAYVNVPNCNNCNLNCPTPYAPNSACNACVCGLDPTKAPSGTVFNATSCSYDSTNGGGGFDLTWLLIGGGGILIIGGLGLIIYLALKKKK